MARIQLDAHDDIQTSQFARGRIHSVETMGTVDGPGIRFVVFTQGCPMRCLYCHNPDTWETGAHAGTEVTVEQLVGEFESNRQFYRNGGITVSGGEPLLQPEFLADLFTAMHARPAGRVHTCLDSCGYAFDPEHPERWALSLDETDLVLLDIKHADPEGHRALTGRDPARILAFGDELARRGIPVVIRHVIVPGHTDTTDECEALLYAAARAQHLADTVLPALEAGKTVLCDRYIFSSFAYQGYGRGLPRQFLLDINSYAVGRCMPDVALFLDIPPVRAFERKHGADRDDRIEQAGADFHSRVYAGYCRLAEEYPDTIVRVDCSGTKFETKDKIVRLLRARGLIG